MSTPRQIQDVVAEIAHLYPSTQIKLSPLPSGVCFLWATLGARSFVIEYDPKRGAGVSENFPDTPLCVGHDEVYQSLDEGIARFKALLADAARTEPASAMALHDKKL